MIQIVFPSPDLRALALRGFLLDHLQLLGATSRPDVPLSEEEFLERARLLAMLTREDLARASAGEGLTIEEGPIARFDLRRMYAVRFVDVRGRMSPLSEIIAIWPQGDVPQPPRSVRAQDEAQDLVLVQWDPPTQNVDGSRPPNLLGYNLYRRKADEAQWGPPLNGTTLLREPRWSDRTFHYGTEYVYVVRAVAAARDGTLVESRDSPPFRFTPRDRFPPSPPAEVIAASAQGIVSLFWTASPEPDVVGYYIYRAPSADAPDSAWVRVNARPHPRTIYHDEPPERGARYAYRITAVDRAGNESPPSAIVVAEAL